MTPNPRSPLEDYSLHIIDLHTGRLSDTRSFKCDKIILSHNQGLYLYRNILAVLSVQQQTIHVFQVGGVNTSNTNVETYTVNCANAILKLTLKKKKNDLETNDSIGRHELGREGAMAQYQYQYQYRVLGARRSSSARILPNDHQQAASAHVPAHADSAVSALLSATAGLAAARPWWEKPRPRQASATQLAAVQAAVSHSVPLS